MKIDNLILADTPVISVQKSSIKDPRKLSRILKIDAGIIEKWNSWVELSDGWYYFKDFKGRWDPSDNFLNELIGEYLACFFELDTVHYKIGRLIDSSSEEIYGLLSKSFRKDHYRYLSPYDLGTPLNCINLSNLKELNWLCKDSKNRQQVLSQILKMVVIDTYMHQRDRNNNNNFLFQKRGRILELAPLYDYEKSFFEEQNCNFSSLSHYHAYIFGLDLQKKEELQRYPELKELFEKMLGLDIHFVLDQIQEERKIFIPDSKIANYHEHDQKVKELIRKAIS